MITCLAALCITGAVVIDGDTLRLDSPGKSLRFRIWGINAPEIKDPGGIDSSGLWRGLWRISRLPVNSWM